MFCREHQSIFKTDCSQCSRVIARIHYVVGWFWSHLFHPSFVLTIVDFMAAAFITPGVLGKRRSACIDCWLICMAGSLSSFRWELSALGMEV